MSDAKVHPFKKKGNNNLTLSKIITISIILLVIVSAFGSFYKVEQWEQGVVLRFGKLHKITSPGLNYKLPFGIDKVYRVPVTVDYTIQMGFRTNPGEQSEYIDTEQFLMLTGDLNIIDIDWTLQYTIDDPIAYLFNVRADDRQREKTLRDLSQSVINQEIGDRTFEAVRSVDRAEIEEMAMEHLQEILDSYEFGIEITSLNLIRVLPPQGEVARAFDDVTNAEADRNRYIEEGREDYNREVPRAEGEAQRIIQEAYGYAEARKNVAIGEVARFNAILEEYRLNGEIYKDRLYFETIEAILGSQGNSEIVDRNLEGFLPIRNLGDSNEQ